MKMHNLVKALLAVPACCLLVATAAAGEAGRILVVTGKVTAVSENGQERPLARRAVVATGDTIRTQPGSIAQVKLADGAVVALKPATEWRIDAFRYRVDGQKDEGFFSLLKGGFRTVTGAIGHGADSEYKVTTPVATIGIRGTHYEANLDGDDLALGVWGGGVSACNDKGCIDLGLDSDFRYGYVPKGGEPEGRMDPPPGIGNGHVAGAGEGEGDGPGDEGGFAGEGGTGDDDGGADGVGGDVLVDDVRAGEILELAYTGGCDNTLCNDPRITESEAAGATSWGVMAIASSDVPAGLPAVLGGRASAANIDGAILAAFGVPSDADGNYPADTEVLAVARPTGFVPLTEANGDTHIVPSWIQAGAWTGVKLFADADNPERFIDLSDRPVFVATSNFVRPDFSALGIGPKVHYSSANTFASFAAGGGSAGRVGRFLLSFDMDLATGRASNGYLDVTTGNGTDQASYGKWQFSNFSGRTLGGQLSFDSVSGTYSGVQSSPLGAVAGLRGSFVDDPLSPTPGRSFVGGFNLRAGGSSGPAAHGIFAVGVENRLPGPAGLFGMGGYVTLDATNDYPWVYRDGTGGEVRFFEGTFGAVEGQFNPFSTSSASAWKLLASNVNGGLVIASDPLCDCFINATLLGSSQDTRVVWGDWYQARATVDPFGRITTRRVNDNGAFVMGDIAMHQVVKATTGTMTFNTVGFAGGDSTGNNFANMSPSAQFTVNFDTGKIDGQIFMFNAATGAEWNLDFGGQFRGNRVVLNARPLGNNGEVTTGSYYYNPTMFGSNPYSELKVRASGRLLGNYLVSGMMGAFDVATVRNNPNNGKPVRASGVFVMGTSLP